jgi:hypothetical protein
MRGLVRYVVFFVMKLKTRQHYHEEGPHQSLGDEFIAPKRGSRSAQARSPPAARLGGLLKFYYREAA